MFLYLTQGPKAKLVTPLSVTLWYVTMYKMYFRLKLIWVPFFTLSHLGLRIVKCCFLCLLLSNTVSYHTGEETGWWKNKSSRVCIFGVSCHIIFWAVRNNLLELDPIQMPSEEGGESIIPETMEHLELYMKGNFLLSQDKGRESKGAVKGLRNQPGQIFKT